MTRIESAKLHRSGAACLIASLAMALAACNGGDSSAERELTVAGSLDRPAVVSFSELQDRPATTQTVDYLSGSTPTTRTYTGTSLWELLFDAGIQTDPSRRNDILNRYVAATGGDGYKAVFALGEINPDFGNRPSLVVYSEIVNGFARPLVDDGYLRVTAPGDIRGGRYVSDLVRLDVRGSASVVAGIGGGTSTQFTVSGAVQRPGTYDLAALQALPRVTRTVGTSVYGGVSLWNFLNTTVGIATDPDTRNDILRMYVVGTGSDGYKAVIAMGEIEPNFGNQPDLIAYEIDGAPLDRNGFARLVVPNDVRAGRFVSNLIAIEVFRAP